MLKVMLSCILGDGVLNFLEFIDLMVNDKEEIEEDLELIEAFRAFDTEDTGTDPNFPTCIRCPSEQMLRHYDPLYPRRKMRFETSAAWILLIHKKTMPLFLPTYCLSILT